jgi:hypothetical protein
MMCSSLMGSLVSFLDEKVERSEKIIEDESANERHKSLFIGLGLKGAFLPPPNCLMLNSSFADLSVILIE